MQIVRKFLDHQNDSMKVCYLRFVWVFILRQMWSYSVSIWTTGALKIILIYLEVQHCFERMSHGCRVLEGYWHHKWQQSICRVEVCTVNGQSTPEEFNILVPDGNGAQRSWRFIWGETQETGLMMSCG